MGRIKKSLLVSISLLLGTYEAYGMENPYKDEKKHLPIHIGKNKATYVFNDSVSYQKGHFKVQSKGKEHFTVPHNPGKFQIQSTEMYDGNPQSMPYEEKLLMKIIEGEDGRVRVMDTTTWPYVIHAQLEMRYPEKTYGGSGILIGPHHILTAAHNVYSSAAKEWAQNITVRLGLNGKAAPFGALKVVKAHTFKQWVQGGDIAHDMALLVLDRSIGSEIGWSGLLSLDDETLLKEDVHVTGYPGDKGFTEMMTMSHKLKTVKPEQLYYDIDTYGGQSGSGIWIDKWGSPYTIGTHTLGEGVLNTGNSGVRLSQHKFETIIKWISKSLLLQGKDPERPIKLAIPEVARGYEDIYKRFLKGVLVYRPKNDSDEGKIELPIAALSNPLGSTFDLSSCEYMEEKLSIATGYRKGKISANANKVEIWIVPRFLVAKELSTMTKNHHLREIIKSGNWDAAKAPIGIFWTWGRWNAKEEMAYCNYLTTDSMDDLGSEKLSNKYYASRSTTPHDRASFVYTVIDNIARRLEMRNTSWVIGSPAELAERDGYFPGYVDLFRGGFTLRF